jgi:hypothetical protein
LWIFRHAGGDANPRPFFCENEKETMVASTPVARVDRHNYQMRGGGTAFNRS